MCFHYFPFKLILLWLSPFFTSDEWTYSAFELNVTILILRMCRDGDIHHLMRDSLRNQHKKEKAALCRPRHRNCVSKHSYMSPTHQDKSIREGEGREGEKCILDKHKLKLSYRLALQKAQRRCQSCGRARYSGHQ